MKTLSFRLLVAMSVYLTSSFDLIASHALGGEITWKCLPSGQYQFQLRFYRDCGNTAQDLPGPSITLQTNFGVTIAMSQVGSNTDVSPTCAQTPAPISCSSNLPVGVGAIQEKIYLSLPVTLPPGPPPATGWIFSFDHAARPPGITNLSIGGNVYLRAVMYPYTIGGVVQSANTCYDSSPRFLEPPKSVICSGYQYTYAQFAFDDDVDSMFYNWAPLLTTNGALVSWNPGYSFASPLPNGGSPTPINNITGNIDFTPSISGSFATCISVSAFRCGQKIAEVFRDIPVIVRTDCPSLPTGSPNKPPSMVVTSIP